MISYKNIQVRFLRIRQGTMASSNADIDMYLSRLKQCKIISENEARDLCYRATNVLMEEPNILELDCPITICGAIEGNFPALEEIFRLSGDIPNTKYLFLGDLVDRGYYSVETVLLLLALKVRYPNRVFITRGKHETRSITQVYGFYDECVRKYGSADVWGCCTDVFDFIPVSATINTQIFCVHGGLSPAIQTLDQLKLMDRVIEVPCEGAMCDLIWSDPQETPGWAQSPRGAGYLFGEDIFMKFSHFNGVDVMMRANQLQLEGYQWYFHEKILSLWSSFNHCFRVGNPGAICSLDDNMKPSLTTFYQRPETEDTS